jgi:formylglycine-generating enzyme required for sulfatase activity
LSEKGNGVVLYTKYRNIVLLLLLGFTLAYFFCNNTSNTSDDPTNNLPPVADAGNDTTVQVNGTVMLHGTGSDPDGNIVEYAWKLGTTVDWVITSSGDTSVIALPPPRADTFYFRVMDNDSLYGYDSLRVTITGTVPIPPVANAGNDTTVKINETIKLHGTGTDADGYITEYSWKIGTGNWIITSTGDTSITAPSTEQILICSLRVKDNDNEVGLDFVTITVQDTGRNPWIPTGPLEYYKGMVKIKGDGFGFQMGSDSGKPHEQPVHTVGFTYDFWMDTVEVAQGKYATIMSASYPGYTTPYWTQQNGMGDKHPAYSINWYDVVLYCNALSKQDGKDTVYSYSSITGSPGNDCGLDGFTMDLSRNGYRLPTEAEWEYSCRGGTTTEYYWGGGNEDDFAWSRSNSSSSMPVGTKTRNVYGLYDMSGNVWEWCHDWYADSLNAGLQIDPTGPASGRDNVIRGGGWYYPPGELRSANRNFAPPDTEGRDIGFRVVLPVK